jgi:ABC-type transport system involved in Fe-S cluster assembly fused permease/ATPase subunit
MSNDADRHLQSALLVDESAQSGGYGATALMMPQAHDTAAAVSPKSSEQVQPPSGDDTIPIRPQPLTLVGRRQRQRHSAVLLAIVFVPAVLGMAFLSLQSSDFTHYSIHKSACDSATAAILFALVDSLLLLICTARQRRGFFSNKLPVTDVIHHVGVLAFIATSTKLWVFTGWDDGSVEGVIAQLVVALAPACALLSLAANHRVHRCDVPATINLKRTSVMQILKPYFWPRGATNRFIILATWALMGVGKACGVVSPLFLAKAVNQLQDNPAEAPYANLAIFSMLALAPRILEEIQDMLVVNIWRVAYVEVAGEAFRHVHKLSLEWHVKKKMGHVIRFMDRGMIAAQQLVSYVAMYLGPAVAVAVSAFIVFATEFRQPEIAAVTYVFMGVYVWMTVVITIWRKIFFIEMNEYDNEMHDKATDSLVNFETVKFFTNEDLEADSYIASVQTYQKNEQHARLSVAVLNMGQATLIETCRMVALMVAATAVMNNEDGFNLGTFMAIQAYLVMIFTPFQFLGSIYEMTIQSFIDMENLSDLLAEEPDLIDHPHARPLLSASLASRPKSLPVEFKNVTFNYPSQSPSSGLRSVSFKVDPGTTTALVGTTGSGKTTITRLLFRFYDTVQGAVLVNGHDVRELTQRSLRENIGIVPQDTVLFNDTIRHNIRYGRPDATEEEVIEAARKAQLLPLIQRFEKGWDTTVGERGLKLSGGEKQRVAIARCLLKNPPIVVLDEATSALDNKTEKEVQEALKALEGRTTIIVAHRLSTIRHADQILVMSRGQIVERGTFNELVDDPNSEFFAMWHAQLSQPSGQPDPST